MDSPEASGSFHRYALPKLVFYLYRKQYTGRIVADDVAYDLRDGIPLGQLAHWTKLFRHQESEFAIYRVDVRGEGRLHPRRVIYHGIRAAYEIERVWRELGTALDGQAARIGAEGMASLARYRFADDDQKLVGKLTEGFWSPGELIAAGEGELKVWRLLYALLVTSMLELRPDDRSPVSRSHGQPVATPAPPSAGPGTYRFSGKTLPPAQRSEHINLPDAVPSEEDQMRERIESTARGLHRTSDFDLLGVAPGASREQLKAAYGARKRAFDPDRLSIWNLEALRDDAARIIGAIEAAYARLVRPFLETEREVEQGLKALEEMRFALAEQHFRRALELRPDDAGAQEGLRLAANRKQR